MTEKGKKGGKRRKGRGRRGESKTEKTRDRGNETLAKAAMLPKNRRKTFSASEKKAGSSR